MNGYVHKTKKFTTPRKQHNEKRINPIWRPVALLVCLCIVAVMTSIIAKAITTVDNNATIAWSSINEAGVIQSDDSDGTRVWDVSKSTKRHLKVPVQFNVASYEDITITLPRYITANIRDKSSYKAEASTDGVNSLCQVTTNENEIHFDFDATDGSVKSFIVQYDFDCWKVVSNQPFEINYKISGDEKETGGILKGKIITGFDFKIVNDYGNYPDSYYSNAYGRDNGYSLNSLGGADRIMSYIQNFSSVYEKYFRVKNFDKDIAVPDGEGGHKGGDYIYDIAPFFVKPSGQQPYDISGTVTVENGEILAGVYLMDSRLGSKAPWKLLEDTDGNKNDNSFTFVFKHSDEFDWEDTDRSKPKLIDKVITGNLTEDVDNGFYTLYFLVRYRIEDLTGEQVKKVNNGKDTAYILSANIDLTHTGVDSETDKKPAAQENKNQLLYRGPITDPQIYDAYYTYFLPNYQDALSTLDEGGNAHLDFEADFFCFNEARKNYIKNNGDKYRLEAVIDLLYLTEKRPFETSDQLRDNDYRFSQFTLSLVDAPGTWSQNWYYEDRDKSNEDDDEVWNERRPNIGWPVETWDHGQKELEPGGYSQVIVYGSKSHDDNEWEPITEFDVWDLWAKDKGRDVSNAGSTENEEKTNQFTIGTESDYVRLKVVYDSRFTTALRLRYNVELKQSILEHHTFLKSGSNHGLTSWLNYFGYTKSNEADGVQDTDWSADCDNMNVDGYYKSDAWDYNWVDEEGTNHNRDLGTIEQARKYDNEQSSELDFDTKFNTRTDDRYDKSYSMRDYVRTFLSRDADMAGMLVTQALYGENGAIVGNNTNSTQLNGGSFAKEKNVTEVSEIVYSISGGITKGYLNQTNLEERRKKEKENNQKSPYTSLKIRYFVLLPAGFELNTDIISDYTPGTEHTFLSTTPSFYNSVKGTAGEDHVVVTSNSNIPAWQEQSGNGALSEMKWNDAGDVTYNEDLSKDRLVVFDRTLEDVTRDEVFNLHGVTETYFWGRGLTFSIIPENGTGTIWTSDNTTQFWCQYLDNDGNPISLEGFNKDIDGNGSKDVKSEELNKNLTSDNQQQGNTLLYIPSDFHNDSPKGFANAEITLESNNLDGQGNPIEDESDIYALQFDKDYAYRLDYSSSERADTDVVLWTNIEDKFQSDPQYRGTVTGVDLSDLRPEVKENVKVYVRTEFFDTKVYGGVGDTGANKNWLDEHHGWIEVPLGNLDSYEKWSEVKAIAFSFGEFIFNEHPNYDTENDKKDIDKATVRIKMKAPERKKYLDFEGDEKTFDAESQLYLSDKRDGNNSGCVLANKVDVKVTVRSITLPDTGGLGATDYVMAGLVLCMLGAVIPLFTRRRRRAKRGYPYRM